MYAPRTQLYPDVGDVEVLPVGDRLHLFHLTLPNHDVVQHAVSDDGLTWRELPAALRTGDPGDCDDDQIWTMSVTERGGTYYMLYTALAKAEGGLVQRTALATSTDLIGWTKHPDNPVGQADPRWYEADQRDSGRVSWRDPKPILVRGPEDPDGTYFATVNGREKDGPLPRRGCVGLLASKDLVRWEPRPPLFAPRRFWDLECPQAFVVNGQSYLTAAIMEDRTQRYWMAPRFAGPYETPPDGGILAPRGHYAGRVCRWQGLDLYYCWHRCDYDWSGIRNPFGKFVVAPLVLTRRDDGSLARGSFPGWEGYRPARPAPPAPAATTLLRGAPVGSGWRLETPGRMDLLATGEEIGDVWLEGTLRLAAGSGGLAFRLDEQGCGYFLELLPGGREVALQRWLQTTRSDDRPWFAFDELQRGQLHRSIAPGEAVPFRLIVAGSYVELSLGGEVVIATLSAARARGRVGIWADGGSVAASDLAWAPLRQLAHR
jgi:beta-fructofuranosidase